VTERLYYTDSYLADFSAKVVAVEGEKVYLDRTAFYPTSGGQPHDLGELGGAGVVDVVDEEDRVAHVLGTPATFAPGAEVSGYVDRARRFDFMQQHTGQHLLSAVFEDLFGHKTVSVHFGDVYSTLDLDTESLPGERAARAEQRANAVVFENRAVTPATEDAAHAAGLRKPPDRAGPIRVVTIEGIDRSACGGTHVRVTGEIGPVMVRRVEKYKKLSRVEFLCGARALARARADFEALSAMAATMTAAIDELPALVAKQAAGLRAADAERRKLADEVARYRARDRYDAAVPDADGVRRIVERAAPFDELRALAQAMAALPKAVFVGAAASPPAVVLAASEDSGVNAGAALKAALAAHGGRGGGSPRVAQGTAGDAAALEAIVAALLAALQQNHG
jgi:alanyl-tRNA synthetase